MRHKADARLVVAGLLAIACAALLSAGLFAIFSAVAQDNLDLPSEGNLTDILRDGEIDATPGSVPDIGLGLDDTGAVSHAYPNAHTCPAGARRHRYTPPGGRGTRRGHEPGR